MKCAVAHRVLILPLFSLIFGSLLNAADLSDLTYDSSGDTVSIISCNDSAEGRIIIPETIEGKPVTSIEERAFYYCRELTAVDLPSSITSIGDFAFYGCGDIISINIPDACEYIGQAAFKECESIPSIAIPSKITAISDGSFAGCRSLETVIYPNGLRTIGLQAFYGSALSSIIIPSSVTTISSSAFSQCYMLESAYFLGRAPSINSSSFRYNAPNFTTYYLSSNSGFTSPTWGGNPSTEIDSTANLNALQYYESGSEVFITDCDSNYSGILIIPDRINGKDVTTINSSAFEYCDQLLHISIPDSVSSIGDYAFYYCRSLTSITIPPLVSSIGDHAFFYCDELAHVYFNTTLSSIESGAFAACHSLTSLTLPTNITSIGNGAFHECRKLEQINIPPNLTEIADYAFIECNSLSNITLHDGITTIGEKAFWECISLESLDIPESVTTIGGGAFGLCRSMSNINIPSGITTIETYTFTDCQNLIEITIPEDIDSIGSRAFSGCSSITRIRLPENLSSIGDYAFNGCSSLQRAYFLGDAPSATSSSLIFNDTADDFTIYYFDDHLGFDSEPWVNYTLEAINSNTIPAARWLIDFGRNHEINPSTDDTGDGVPLLMAHALNLNPNDDLANQTPRPSISDTSMEMSFFGNQPGISYKVEVSQDLETWSDSGVVLSAPDIDGIRSANFPRSHQKNFMRLAVEID